MNPTPLQSAIARGALGADPSFSESMGDVIEHFSDGGKAGWQKSASDLKSEECLSSQAPAVATGATPPSEILTFEHSTPRYSQAYIESLWRSCRIARFVNGDTLGYCFDDRPGGTTLRMVCSQEVFLWVQEAAGGKE